MRPHENFFQIVASDHYEAGLLGGRLFRRPLQTLVWDFKSDGRWRRRVKAAERLLMETEAKFPQYVEELRGMAKGADVPLLPLWASCMEAEIADRCTTVVTNRGLLVGHNEDWNREAANWIVILQRRIGAQESFQLHYLGSLGGNAISANAHGCVHAVNSLAHSDRGSGVPRDVIARWLSDGDSARSEVFGKVSRTSGYHHTLVQGKVASIESSAREHVIIEPVLPFVHTNHYVSRLRHDHPGDGGAHSRTRLERAQALARAEMSALEMMNLLDDRKDGPEAGLCNERTIAGMVIDLETGMAHVRLVRESRRGWVTYPLDFLPSGKGLAKGRTAVT